MRKSQTSKTSVRKLECFQNIFRDGTVIHFLLVMRPLIQRYYLKSLTHSLKSFFTFQRKLWIRTCAEHRSLHKKTYTMVCSDFESKIGHTKHRGQAFVYNYTVEIRVWRYFHNIISHFRYYFQVRKTIPGVTYTFTIINFLKRDSLYNHGKLQYFWNLCTNIFLDAISRSKIVLLDGKDEPAISNETRYPYFFCLP